MAKRHADAMAIQQGAVNPSGIAYSILDACQEIREEGGGTADICQDPAVRLMVHQLASICRVAEVDDDLETYSKLTEQCGRLASAGETTKSGMLT